MYNAVEKDHIDIARMLLGANADLELVTTDGNTALLRAVKNRNPEIVKLLLDKKGKTEYCRQKWRYSLTCGHEGWIQNHHRNHS